MDSSPQDAAGFHHVPVLAEEVLTALAPQPGELFVDGTLGGGGHSESLLRAGAHVIGLDQDATALAHASERLRNFGEAFHPVRANFRDLRTVLNDLGIGKIDGLLLDIGVSSHQLDTASRGFSFQSDGPLDMRMDQSAPMTAADLVNTADVEELIRIFRKYGEEPSSVRIAKHLVEIRQTQPFSTTAQLAAAVESILPRRGKRHPATQIFQALRIAVNDELGALEAILNNAPAPLNKGARFAVITFHSLEDRLVKQDFRARSQATLDRPEWAAPRPNPAHVYQPINRKSITASTSELSSNPRARSARLRAVQKI
ncbi:MAG: 16S rRNA (cytosine(1402)-N(4))-methyltransferase RsmH [Chthoniobacterales bacterium]